MRCFNTQTLTETEYTICDYVVTSKVGSSLSYEAAPRSGRLVEGSTQREDLHGAHPSSAVLEPQGKTVELGIQILAAPLQECEAMSGSVQLVQ